MILQCDQGDIIIIVEQNLKNNGRMKNNIFMKSNDGQMVQNLKYKLKFKRNMIKGYYNF
ncbi:unnamed protein product [Paramecium primaurelia]|uniref:Uncharacterized protein n=1 Tax=Paramecium primaurelia TaxID=5886 RepID=A0A8S1LT89_PARPR|nr:unnamed protein product [Paramecium primaurelia]